MHADADLDAFETDVRRGIFTNAGQVCNAISRVIAHDSIHDALVARIAKLAKSLTVKPGMEQPEAGPSMGALVSDAQRDRALGMVADAVAAGATLITGGHKPNLAGAFMEPTVLANVTPDMVIAQEDVFGPVISLMKFSSDVQAIEIANGTPYGLVGGVFTRDLNRATHVARQLRTGRYL